MRRARESLSLVSLPRFSSLVSLVSSLPLIPTHSHSLPLTPIFSVSPSSSAPSSSSLPSTISVMMLSVEKGQHIYAYCNIRTNQVLYSLERTLRHSHLSQLADVGANNSPPKLRKDLWRPLFTVSVPSQRQGLELFKKLREYRLLHETNWALTEEIKRPYTDKQIADRKAKLEDRGGSKKETVFDVIKREKKKMRIKMVMDQKANSVADLAAILMRQEEKGARLVDEKEIAAQARKKQAIDEICRLAARFEKGGMAELEGKTAELKAHIQGHSERSVDKSAKSKQRKEEYQKLRKARAILDQTKLQRRKMVYAVEAVKAARKEAAEVTAAQEAAAREKEAAEVTTAQEVSAREKDAAQTDHNITPTASAPLDPIDWRQYIKPYPSSLDPVLAAQEGHAFGKRHPALRANAKDIKLVQAPIFHTEGIFVKWANALDAEYAEIWPTGVQHEKMGFVRNTAPVPDQEAAKSISDMKARMWKTRSANWDASIQPAEEQEITGEEDGEVGEVESAQEQDRKAVLSDIKEQILRAVKRRTGRPFWAWQREEKRLARKGKSQEPIKTASPTGGQTEVDLTAEPTSAENAPTL